MQTASISAIFQETNDTFSVRNNNKTLSWVNKINVTTLT